MSFGIGYVRDGVWVDHSTLPAGGIEADTEARDLMAFVHEWYGCCEQELATPPSAVALEVAVERERAQVGS